MVADKRTEAEFRQAVVSRYIPALLKLATHKGEQYAGEIKPALSNFYEGSRDTLDSPEHYLLTLATKQWRVLADWALTGMPHEVATREIVQRLFDVIIYMLLLLFMIEYYADIKLPGEE